MAARGEMALLDTGRIAASLYGMLVGDALAMPVHWFYSPKKLRADYGEITGMVAPKANHAESMVQGMSYSGTIDIMHGKARFYEGNKMAEEARSKAAESELRDDHGNFIGHVAEERVHYHQSLLKGQNTVNACLARLGMRYLAEKNAHGQDYYEPDEYLQRFYTYMTTPPDPQDKDQVINHNDVYLDVYLRGFFTKASQGTPLRECALSQRDTWSIGSLDGVVMSLPIIAAYAYEPEWYLIGRAVEHATLTHRSVTVIAAISVLAPLLRDLYHGGDLRTCLDRAMSRMSPPAITGRQLADSYVNNHGPGHIPKHDKWLQHMQLDHSMTTKDLVHSMLDWKDEDVAGWRDEENSRLSTACYCEHTLTVAMYLAYKYADDPAKALLQNAMLGGHSTARGAVLGAILGAGHGQVPFVDDLCAKSAIDREIAALIAALPQSGSK